jgi:hypothetical protein
MGLESRERLDLLSNIEDVLDTWGPGQLVYQNNGARVPVAIKIGGGFISPPAQDSKKYHWSMELKVQTGSPIVELQKQILIGSLVKSNPDCKIDEAKCWKESSTYFEELGVHRSLWEYSHRQLGLQVGGQFALGQANATWVKRVGQTVKSVRLREDEDLLVRFLEKLWGVQVSFCTGVARRVPLRELVADVLPAFECTCNFREKEIWNDIKENHKITSALRNGHLESFQDWFANLPEQLRHIVSRMVRRILETLEPTGLDPSGRYFSIAWPVAGHIDRCFRIRLESYNSWAAMLADSHDCATFAYVSPNCLETCDIKCRGPNPCWNNKLYLLETAVFCPAPCRTQTWELRHAETYYFEKLDTMLWFKVQKERGAEQATLVKLVSAMSIPQKFRQSLRLREEKKQRARLKERDCLIVNAELVSVLSLSAS